MSAHPLAGRPVPPELLIDVAALERAYYERAPDPGAPAERVAFGTSGHRGSSLRGSFKWDPLESTCRHASLSIL